MARRYRKLFAFLGRADGSIQHKALRSGVWVGVSSIGIAVLTFARGVVLARLLSPEVFGLMAVCLMATRLIEIFTETGFGAALIHRQKGFEEARDTAFTMMILRGVGLAVLSVLVAPWVARFYEQPVLAPLIAVIGLSFVFVGCQNINIVALQKELDFRRLTYMELTGSVLGFAVSVGLAYWLRSVWALVFAQVASSAITSVLSFLMVPARVRLRLDFAIARELYRYGRYITGLAIVVFFTRELDNAVIGKILGMQHLGYYVVAYSLANIPSTYLSKVIARVMFPLFSQLQSDPDRLRAEYARGIRLVTVVVVPVSVTMAVLAPEIIRALYGVRWASAAAPLQVLAGFGCFRALWMLNGYLYNAIGRPHIDFYLSLARLIVMAVLLFPLARMFGIVGAAAAVTVPMAIQFLVGVYLSRRLIHTPARTTVRPLVVAGAQGIVLAVVLVAAKSVVVADPRLGLLMLMALGGGVCLALNARDIRTLVGTYVVR